MTCQGPDRVPIQELSTQSDEGQGITQETLGGLQDRPPQGASVHHQQEEPEVQAASRLRNSPPRHHGTYRRHRPTQDQARLHRSHVHLRDRAQQGAGHPEAVDVDPDKKVQDWDDDEQGRIRQFIIDG